MCCNPTFWGSALFRSPPKTTLRFDNLLEGPIELGQAITLRIIVYYRLKMAKVKTCGTASRERLGASFTLSSLNGTVWTASVSPSIHV